ncbi:MAG TPA: hypothetical protein VJ816_06045 [Gemmatimonadales bacterium]|nr:hypothetical protein [Gemmatimonadales bacterium]
MIHVESPHPPGVVGLSCGELARFTEFHAAYDNLMAPPRTARAYGISYDTASNSNDIIRQMQPWHEWVSIWDDDHWFEPDVLLKMLAHRVDLIIPLYYQRKPPFFPVLYRERDARGACTPYMLTQLKGRRGLIDDPVSAGKSGILMSRAVVSKLAGGECQCPATPETQKRQHADDCTWAQATWFKTENGVGEDHVFFRNALAAGFKLHCDLDIRLDHISPFRIRPIQTDEGEWQIEVNLYNNVRIVVRIPPEAQEGVTPA